MLNKKARKSIVVMLILIVSSLFTININPVNAVDKTTNYSSVFYVTEQKGDAYYLNGYEFRNNSSLGYLKNNVYDTYSGFKFTTVTLTNASIIDHAYLSLYSSDGVDNYDYMVTIYGEDIDSGNDFDTSTDLTGATLTSSYSNWNMKNLEGNQWRNSTDIKTSITEIINRVGWSSGNNVSLILLGVISANGYRTFRTWDYDGGHTYRAKLYIEYHTIAPVSNSNPWDYISDFNTNWNLLNETNGYTWWETWNITGVKSSYGLVSAVNSNQGRIYRLNFTDYADIPAGIVLWSPSQSMVTSADRLLISAGSTLYCLGYKVSNANLYLMNSTDSGDTWNLGSVCGNGDQFGLAYDGNDKIFIVWRSGVAVQTYFVIYTISTKTYSSTYTADPNLSSTSRVSNPVYVPVGNKFMFVVAGYNNVYIYAFDMDTLTQDVCHGVVVGTATYNPIIHANSDSSEFYCLFYVGPLYGLTIDDDCQTHGVVETTISDNVYTYGNAWFDLDYSVDHWVTAYLKDADKYLYMNERTGGSWGSKVLKSNLYTMVGLGIDYGSNILASNGYATFIQSWATPTTKDVLSSAKSWGSIKQLTSIGSTIQGLDIVTVGSDVESEHKFILLDPEGNPVDEIPEFPPTPLLMNTTLDSWLFKGEVYTLNATVQNTNEAEFNLTDGYHTMIFYYNNLTSPITHRVYTLDADGTLINEDVIGGIKTSHTLDALNVTRLTWKFILGINVLDIFNTTITYKLVSWNMTSLISVSISGITNSTTNIYNLGGNAQYSFAGDGSHVLGGHPFELKATNSSLVVGGSYAESWLIYRRLQYIHLLADLDLDNEVEAVEHFEPLVNIGYAEFGIDYKLEGEEGLDWIEGWKCRIYAQEINVGTYGAGNDMAYIKMYVFWYNRGDFVTGNEFYSYHQGYDITPHFPTPRRDFTFWVDLWFDKTNSSTVFGGRVNAEYYGYYEDGSNWWFNSAFRPMIGNTSYSMILGNIKDNNGTIIQSKRISLVRVTSKVAKTAPGMGGLGDVNTYKLKPFNTLEVNLATDRMEGINTPPMISTGYLDIGGYGIWGFLINAINGLGDGFFNLTKLFLSSADTILSWFGLPYGTFSNIISFLSILPTMLYNFLNILYQMFTSIITVIVSGSALFILTIAGWVSVMISTINLISNFITIFIDLFRGGYGTGVDIWTTYQVATWLSLILLLLPLMWFQRLYRSEHPLATIANDIELVRMFTISMIGFFDWLFDKVLYIAQVFISLIRG